MARIMNLFPVPVYFENCNFDYTEEFEFLKDKHVLIVDELSDTMGTLNLLVNLLVEKGFKENNLGIAVLYDKKKKKQWSPIMDDFVLGENYFVAERIEDRWVVFPWDNF